MRSESMRLGRSVSDGSRQPPTCTTQFRRITFYSGNFRLLASDNRKFSYPFALRHKLGTLVVHGTSGKDSQTSQRIFTEEDSDDQQSADVGSWWQATQQTDGAEPQLEHRHRQNEQALPHLNRNITALSRAPRLNPFHRSLESIPPIGPSTATNAPIRNRVLAAAAAGGDGGSDADTPASTPHSAVLLPTPTAAPLPPVGSTSPHSRALSFLSTAVSVLAVGAYVYTIVKRRQASGDATASSGTMSQGPVAAPAPPAPLPPKKVGAGSGLFRPANAAGTTPAKTAAKDAANAAALGQLPAAAAAAAAAGVVIPTDAGAATAPRPAAVVAGPEQPRASPSRERGWWRRLARVYYISFGAQYGLVPRVRLDGTAGTLGSGTATSSAGGGGGSGGAVLAAFEDAADAEYVANALWEDLVQNGAQPSGPRPSTMGVLSAAPIFLEDLAAMRGAPVEVVPADGLRKDVQLSTAQLEVVLAALVRGASPEAAAAQAERVLDEAAAAAATAAAADSTSESPSGAALDGGRGGATSAAARGRAGAGPAMVRNPLERTAEQHGVKIKLPSKFDFPGFDAEGASKSTAVPSSAQRPAPPVSDRPTVEAVSAAAAAAAAAAHSFSAPSTDSLSTPPPPPPSSGEAPVAAVAAMTLPQVTPSAVQEPARGVRGGVSEDDLQSDVWMPYGGERIIDTEAVEVSPTLASSSSSSSAAAAAMPPSSAPPVSGAAAATAAAVTASAVPSREAYEAMREYQELETLLMMATNTSGGGAAAAAAAAVAADRRDESWQVIAADSRRGAASSTLTGPAAAAAAAASLSPNVSEEGDQWLQPSLQPSQQLQPQQPREEKAQVEPAKRKSGPERAAEVIAQKGPTDVAVEAALAALGDAGDERAEEEDIFDEYYSIFNSRDRQEEDSPSSSNGSSSGSRSNGSSGSSSDSNGQPRGGAGSAGSSSDLAAEVAEVQRLLAGVVQAVAAAHASGSPPPADAATTMQRLQQQLHSLQGRLTAASPAATMPAPVTVTPATSRSTTAAAAAGGATTTSSRQSGGLFSAPPPLKAAVKAAGAGGGGASAPSAPAATTMNPDPATLVTPLSPAGGGATAAKADARRAWGSWKTNRRVQEAEATLLKAATRAATLPPAEPAAAPLPPPPRAAPTAPPAMAADDGGSSMSGGSGADSEGVVVLSKRVGSNRPPKVVETPEVRQDRVKEALRVFSEMGSDIGQEEDDEQLFGRSASLLAGGRKPWWQQRFQALFLPTIGYPDGSMGFLQVNVSLSGDRRDMRVLAFEDRSDCTACLTLMAQWPEHEGTEPRMSMMPTEKLLQQLQDIYDEQPDVNSGVSRPRGLAVFRRSKLPMRPGMGPDDFIQAVVYQHAAQVALARTGYGFNS